MLKVLVALMIVLKLISSTIGHKCIGVPTVKMIEKTTSILMIKPLPMALKIITKYKKKQEVIMQQIKLI